MKERKEIVDSTLRDGEQMPGIAFSVDQKVQIANILNALHIHEIEAGIPCLGSIEQISIEQIIDVCDYSKVSVWSRLNQEDIKKSIQIKPDIIHIGVPMSYPQIYSKLKKNKTWVQKQLVECVDIALEAGVDVTVGFEDASRADLGFMINTAVTLKELGVPIIRIADTVGVLVPDRIRDIIKNLKVHTDIDLEIHMHNDLGMAVANSVEGAKSGAKYIDCTLLGLGERVGNCSLIEFLYAGEELFEFNINKKAVKAAEEQLKNMIHLM